jgi:hypothetical protein
MNKDIVYKSHQTVYKEWKAICEQHNKALERLFKIQKTFTTEYPSSQLWEAYISAQAEYNNVRNKMDNYRNTVQISD